MTSLYPSTALVVVDSTVKDHQDLIRSVESDTEIVILDAAHDGIEQITAKLRNYHELSSLHILSHGAPGAIRLGNVWLSLATMERYTDQIQSWAKSIAHDASVFLYGCRVAAGTSGQSFVQQLSQLLRAPIAASATPTGNTALGGDWSLEFTTGTINTALPFSPDATAAYPHVLAVPVSLLTETFRGSDVDDKRWLFGIENAAQGQLNPFLTARNTAEAPAGGLPGNPSPGSAPYPALDSEGNGALRLTNAINNQAAYVLYNNPLPANAGLIIEFELFSYGGTGADGIGFFLADGANPPTVAGGFGGSLGYAQRNGLSGVQGGYLGVGIDEYGNYSNPTEGRILGPGFIPDAVAIRGSQANNYAYLGGTGLGELPYSIDVPGATTRDAAGRKVRVEISPTGLLSVAISIDANQNGSYTDAGETQTVLQNFDVVAANGAPPDTLTFGFASGTGSFTNNHEIRNLQVSQPTSPPEVADSTLNLPAGTVAGVPGLSATDPDGTIVSYTITTLPPAEQGTLYLGNPSNGGTPLAAGQVLTPAQIGQVFFQSTPGFTGATFTYNATDDVGAVDQTPGTVTLALRNPNNDLPIANNIAAELAPGSVTRLPELTASDPDGTIASYTIVSLPPSTQGILYLGDPSNGGRLVTAGETLTPAQVGQLFFQAEPDFTGGRFTFYATDNEGAISNIATASLDDPGSNALPVASGNTVDLNPDSTRRLPELVATDPDGTVTSYTIVSLPPRGQGRLYLGNPNNGGRLVEAGETLTPAQVGRLFFQADSDFTGGRLTFFATDNEGGVSNTATITLNAGTDLDPGIDDPDDENCEPGIRRKGGSGNNTIRGTGDIDTLLGGAGSDTLRGLDCPDLLQGNQGNDEIFGGNAGDTLNGGLGRDRLNGENGNDQLFGRRGNDTLDGGKGNDRLFGLVNSDRLNGRAGNDYLVGGAGGDTVSGGANSDTMEGRQNRDRMIGENGDDTIYGNLAIDTLNGGNGADAVYGGKGNDQIKGNASADFLTGQRSDDRIHGGSQTDYVFGDVGDDTLTGGGGADTLNGSLGVDRFVFRNINHGGDLVEGFQLSDVFDFRGIFARDGYTRTGTFAYIRQVQSGADIVVQVDSNGNRSGGFINYLTIQGATSTDLANGGQVTASNFIV